MKAIIEGAGTRATVVLVGAIDGNDVRIAVENNGAWTGLVALGANFQWLISHTNFYSRT